MVVELFGAVVFGIVSIISLFGWFFCLGNLLVSRIPAFSKNPPLWLAGSISFVLTAAILAIFSPIFPLTKPITILLGLLVVIAWLRFRPPFPTVTVPREINSPFFVISLMLFTVYLAIFLFIPERSFDALAYHLPFAREFAETGQVGYPPSPQNWVGHIHYSYPRAIELVFGLVHQTHEALHNLLHFWLLLLAAGGILHLSRVFRLSSGWVVLSFLLAAPTFFNFMKMFPVELGLFVGVITLISLLPFDKAHIRFTRGHALLLLGLGLFFGLSKINAGVYVGAICLVAFAYFPKSRAYSVIPVIGAGLGVSWFILQSFLHGGDFFLELKIAQALTSGMVVPVGERITRIAISAFSLGGLAFIFFGIGGALYLAWRDHHFRPLALILIGSFLFFVAAFTASSLYVYTYSAFGIYQYAFLGLASLIIARLYTLGKENSHFFIRILTWFTVFAIFAAGFYFIFFMGGNYFHGFVGDTSRYYPDLVRTVPNDSSTVLFFMNNINPIAVGFERATIVDHTTFPLMEGDPCYFWRENGITHVAYWAQHVPTSQLDGGNPAFYSDALSALRENRCSTLLFDGKEFFSPIIARINP
jgi:hypothetical protein